MRPSHKTGTGPVGRLKKRSGVEWLLLIEEIADTGLRMAVSNIVRFDFLLERDPPIYIPIRLKEYGMAETACDTYTQDQLRDALVEIGYQPGRAESRARERRTWLIRNIDRPRYGVGSD
jgi:hypothetical protein